jgi:hypothetical protein
MRSVAFASIAALLMGLAAVPQAQTPAANQPGAPAAGAPAQPAGRGGRGTPPPPVEKPPAVMPAPVRPFVSMAPPSPDPRVGLRAGRWDAAQTAWNMRLISQTPPPEGSLEVFHSDLAFSGRYVVQGNYNGFEIWDIANPARPALASTYVCPASQNDVSVYRNLLFMSSEAPNSRSDCGFGGVPDPVSKERVRGIRIFDISNLKSPKLVTSVQTCRGSHTHTVVTQPGDNDNVYIYVSGTSSVRSDEELPGCALPPGSDQGAARVAGPGGDRQLAAHLQRPAGAAEERGARQGGPGGPRSGGSRACGGGRGRGTRR